MTDAILVLNAGSSSLKFAVYPIRSGATQPILRGKVAGIGGDPVLSIRDSEDRSVAQADFMPLNANVDHNDIIPGILDWLKSYQDGVSLFAAGHRVVHGGRDHEGPAKVTDPLLAKLDALAPLAPLHQPHNLAAIRIVAAAAPHLPQVASFDTSFHRTQSRIAQIFALPRALTDAGVIRYGFHGLSYDYIAGALPKYLGDRAEGRVIIAHLGSGASICAMKDRRSVATSMGFTALDGLVMGRRCGALDPGVVLYLLNEKKMEPDEIEQLLYRKSGLLGVSGLSNDMAILQGSVAPEAIEAIDLFCFRAAGEIARQAAAIGGLDALVFTAGIGQKSARVRRQIIQQLDWMGIKLEPDANDVNAIRIGSTASSVEVLVIPTDEESVIARDTLALIDSDQAQDKH